MQQQNKAQQTPTHHESFLYALDRARHEEQHRNCEKTPDPQRHEVDPIPHAEPIVMRLICVVRAIVSVILEVQRNDGESEQRGKRANEQNDNHEEDGEGSLWHKHFKGSGGATARQLIGRANRDARRRVNGRGEHHGRDSQKSHTQNQWNHNKMPPTFVCRVVSRTLQLHSVDRPHHHCRP